MMKAKEEKDRSSRSYDERKRASTDDRGSKAPDKAEGAEETSADEASSEPAAEDVDRVIDEVIEEKSELVNEAPLPEAEQASDESNKQTADAASADA
jgi:hypothetical protein